MFSQASLAVADLQTWSTDCCLQRRSTDSSVKVNWCLLCFYSLAAVRRSLRLRSDSWESIWVLRELILLLCIVFCFLRFTRDCLFSCYKTFDSWRPYSKKKKKHPIYGLKPDVLLLLCRLLQAQQISAWCQSAPPAWERPARTTAPASRTPQGPTTAPARTASRWVSQKVFRVNKPSPQILPDPQDQQLPLMIKKSHFFFTCNTMKSYIMSNVKLQ